MAHKSGRFRNPKKDSYSKVSNTILRDETLSLQAKGLAGLIESYLSLENFSLYKNFLIKKSANGETSFRTAWSELKAHGYLIQYKMKDNDTKQFYYEYEMREHPSVEKPHVENPHMDNIPMDDPLCDFPHVDIPQPDFPHMDNEQVDKPHVDNLNDGFPTSGKAPIYINTINSNSVQNNTLQTNKQIWEEVIHRNIDYNTVFVGSNDVALVDNIISIMVDTILSISDNIQIGNSMIPKKVLIGVINKVNMHHILYTVNTIKNYPNKIYNIKNFIIATIYNSVMTLEVYYTNQVNSDYNNSNVQ